MKTTLSAFVMVLALCTLSGPAIAVIGAEDVVLRMEDQPGHLVATGSGTLFHVVNNLGNSSIELYRSLDNGVTWGLWSTIGDDGRTDTTYRASDAICAGAAADRIMVAVRYILWFDGSILLDMVLVYRADPTAENPSWTNATVASHSGYAFNDDTVLATDAINFADYNVYCAFTQRIPPDNLVMFSRSTDQGATFPTPIVVADSGDPSIDLWTPDLDYGYGGYLHLTWTSSHEPGNEGAAFYRRAANRAETSQSWDTINQLSNSTDGWYDIHPTVAASQSDESVLVSYVHCDQSVAAPDNYRVEIHYSIDHGAAFRPPVFLPGYRTSRAGWNPSGYVIATTDRNDSGLLRPIASPSSGWAFEPLLDDEVLGSCTIASNPAQNDRWAAIGNCYHQAPDQGYFSHFDAEWFQDPGYPVFAGDLPDGDTHVCLTDLEGDGIMEIVYASHASGLLRVYDGHLRPKSGFPVPIETFGDLIEVDYESIACGDVDGDGDQEIFVGVYGMIYAFDHLGQHLPGWPVSPDPDWGSTMFYKISLGTLSRSSPLDIVATSPFHTHVFRPDGSRRPGWPVDHYTPATGIVRNPAALGDVDGDGQVEMVLMADGAVFTLGPNGVLEQTAWADTVMQTYPDCPVRLADMDLDGDLEILFGVWDPDFNLGTAIHLKHHDGTDFGPSWPYVPPTNWRPGPLAIANNLGNSAPEVFFYMGLAQGMRQAQMLTSNGTVPSGWPHDVDSFITGVPLVDQFNGFPSGVVMMTGSGIAYGFKNFMGKMDGWPRDIPVGRRHSGASGDIDGDGLTELIVPGSMRIYDTNGTATSDGRYRWPQHGFDSEGTSCANCPVDRVSSAPGESPAFSRVSFRGGFPNPFSGETTLAYELPAGAAVRLEIYDVRGRLVREIARAEQAAGPHAMVWDRMDAGGHPVAGGTYLARLTARGPGLKEIVTRKITVLR